MTAWTIEDVEKLPAMGEAQTYTLYVLPDGSLWLIEIEPDGYEKCRWERINVKVTDEMVDRFLSWKLPEDFNPDGGVHLMKPRTDYQQPNNWPVGTNLFTAIQARAMLKHVLQDLSD